MRVPTKLMAHARDGARSYGKSDPIDALAVAKAAQREPDLPAVRLDGPAREVRLLSDHRDHLVAERTRVINRLRWRLHELDPDNEPPARDLRRPKHLNQVEARLTTYDGLVARLAGELLVSCRQLTERIHEFDRELDSLVAQLAPTLLSICRCATLTAAKILGETADVRRFRSRHAFAIRDRAAARVVQQPSTTSTQPHRQPSNQRRDPPRRHHPGPLVSTGATAPRPPPRQWQEQLRSDPRPQTTAIRRRLLSPPARCELRRDGGTYRGVIDIGAREVDRPCRWVACLVIS